MKHVGIMTMHRVRNYGSFLQAYALKRLLEMQGNTVSFVDIQTKPAEHSADRTLKKLRRVDRYLIKRLRFRKLRKASHKMFQQVQAQYLGILPNHAGWDSCDAVVIGSDEIFNCEHKGAFPITSERFGYIPDVPRTISYAASCGYTGAGSVVESERSIIAKGIQALKSISVRDENTAEFVASMGGKNVRRHLDPVLVYSFSQELAEVNDSCLPHFPYMIVYAYHDRIHDPAEIAAICSYARAHRLKTVAIGGMQPWCDKYVTPTPFEVLSWFRSAACVVTDTFHGTIISAKFHKPFAVLVRDSNANKLEDLLWRLSIQSHKASWPEEIAIILDSKQDWKSFERLIAAEAVRTTEYLSSALM